MITDWQIQREGDTLILGLVTDNAVLDIVSDRATLCESLTFLRSPHTGLVHRVIGCFGAFEVTLNLHHDDRVSIFVDGPEFQPGRVQSAAIWVDKQRLQEILEEITRTT